MNKPPQKRKTESSNQKRAKMFGKATENKQRKNGDVIGKVAKNRNMIQILEKAHKGKPTGLLEITHKENGKKSA